MDVSELYRDLKKNIFDKYENIYIFLFPWINTRKSIYIYLMSISYNIRDMIHNASEEE